MPQAPDSGPNDTVPLTDLEVIAQYSLAVRQASAPRAEVIAALEADLAFLTGGGRRTPVKPAAKAPAADPAKASASASAKRASVKKAPAKKAAASGRARS